MEIFVNKFSAGVVWYKSVIQKCMAKLNSDLVGHTNIYVWSFHYLLKYKIEYTIFALFKKLLVTHASEEKPDTTDPVSTPAK